jgi:hypothetical protein
VLAVVEHQQHGSILDELLDRSRQREVLALLDVECAGDQRDGGVCVAHRGQLDDGHLREPFGAGCCDGHGDACLADAPRAEDRDDRTLLERLSHGLDVIGATDELGGLTARQRGLSWSERRSRWSEQGGIVGEDLRLQRLRRR